MQGRLQKLEPVFLKITYNTYVVPYYPVYPSPPQIYPHGLKSEFKPTGLKYGPIFSIRENKKTLQVQLFFLLNITEIYRIPS